MDLIPRHGDSIPEIRPADGTSRLKVRPADEFRRGGESILSKEKVMATAAFVKQSTVMQFTDQTAISSKRLWSGRILSGLVLAFLLMDSIMKLFKPVFVVEATVRLGFPESTIVPIGAVLLACTALYMIPRTSLFGALLLTGYLGGAVAANVRAQQGLFNMSFPVIFAILAWAGLWLRDRRLELLLRA
jgi:hypothetical protein